MADDKLSTQKCVPCEGGISPLTRKEAEEYLGKLQGNRWELDDASKDIEGGFEFFAGQSWSEKWQRGIKFIAQIAKIAQEEDHHPTSIKISAMKEGGLVKVKFSTHSIGGLSKNDFIMAAKLNEVYEHIKRE